MRLKHSVYVQVGADTALNDKLFYLEAEQQAQQIDDFTSQASGTQAVAAGATESLSFGDVTAARGLYLRSDGDVNVDINGLGVIELKRQGTEAKLFLEAALTGVDVTNPSGDTPVNLVYCVWGDPT